MDTLKEFCTETMTTENRKYFMMGYQSALLDQENMQRAVKKQQAANLVTAVCLLSPVVITLLADIITGGIFTEDLFMLFGHALYMR